MRKANTKNFIYNLGSTDGKCITENGLPLAEDKTAQLVLEKLGICFIRLNGRVVAYLNTRELKFNLSSVTITGKMYYNRIYLFVKYPDYEETILLPYSPFAGQCKDITDKLNEISENLRRY